MAALRRMIKQGGGPVDSDDDDEDDDDDDDDDEDVRIHFASRQHQMHQQPPCNVPCVSAM